MAYAKLKNGMEERSYSLPYHVTMEQRTHNQLYRFQLQYLHIFEGTLEIHSNLCDDTPENAIKNLISRITITFNFPFDVPNGKIKKITNAS